MQADRSKLIQFKWKLIKAETKGTPSKNADKKPTVKSMLAIVGQPLTKDEESFAGRRKGEYQLYGPDEPITHVEAIYRKDHTSSIFYLHHASDDNGKLIQGEFRRELAHGIWQKKGDHLYFLDLVFNDKKNPEKEQMVIEAVLIEASKAKFVYKIPESKDEEEIILESILNEESVEKFEHPEMRAYNSADALQSFDLLRAYRNTKERPPED